MHRLILFAATDLPLVAPCIMVLAYLCCRNFKQKHIVKVLAVCSILIAVSIALLRYGCNIVFGVDNVLYPSILQCLVVSYGLIAVIELWPKKNSSIPIKIPASALIAFSSCAVFYAAYLMLEYAWFVHHLHLD